MKSDYFLIKRGGVNASLNLNLINTVVSFIKEVQ